MHVAGLVVRKPAAGVCLQHVLARDGQRSVRTVAERGAVRERHRTVQAHLGTGRQRHLARELKARERRAGVSAGKLHNLVAGIVGEGERAAQAVRRVAGTTHERGDVAISQRLQLHDAAARDERRVDLEVGVLRRGADEDDDAILHGMKQRVLLRAAEAVNLVHEQDRAHAAGHETALCGVNLSAQVLDGARDGRDLGELGVRGVGDDARERGLARAGRPVEDHAREHVVLDGAPQPRVRAHGLRLAHVLGEGLRAHAHGQRRVHVALVALDF